MPDDVDLTKKVEEATASHDIDIKSARRFGNSLSIEADHHVNELSYLAAILFYKLSDYEFEKVTIRHSKTRQTKEFDMYEILGRLITAADFDDDTS